MATTGGGPKDGQGAYFERTVLIDVDPASRGFHEELFGPVAVVVKAHGYRSRRRTGERLAVRPRRGGIPS